MDMRQSPSGQIIQSLKGYHAFVPYALPPKFEWNTRLVNSLSRADFLLGKLAREGSRLPNPHLLIRPFITREAVLSSKIEGTEATLGEILAADAGAHVNQNADALQEVQNYIRALDYGLKRLAALPLSLRLIKEIHAHLMEGVRGTHATPGAFRTSENWIGLPGCTLHTAKFVPPPPEHLMDSLGKFEDFLHDRSLPPLIHMALCHYQFEAIHPFLDGNGRIGRLLITLLLIEQNILPLPLLYLSAFFEATRNEYYKQLYNVTLKGSWHEWFTYFLNGIAVQSEDVLSRTERINALLTQWKMDLARGSSQVLIDMVQLLAVNPYFTINKVAKDLKISYSTAQRGVQKLEDAAIIKKTRNNKRDKVYCAIDLLNILEEPTRINADIYA
ncbi:Fic family protein [Cardinium endosymbiont of Nabis limbatus]|uniref:Fic family protein n=1 Tax=Cardinium endosymbiont of Nabis limbatus TaxID=3066217 RepID=UPI003AF37B8E